MYQKSISWLFRFFRGASVIFHSGYSNSIDLLLYTGETIPTLLTMIPPFSSSSLMIVTQCCVLNKTIPLYQYSDDFPFFMNKP